MSCINYNTYKHFNFKLIVTSFFVATFLALFTPAAFAAGASNYLNMPGPFYQDIGYMGAGGAGVATTADANAVFYNPAGLAEIQNISFALVNVQAEGSTALFQGTSYLNNGSFYNDLKAASQYNGDILGIGLDDYSYFAMHDFSVGVIINTAAYANPEVPATITSPTTPIGSVAARGDAGGVIGLSHQFDVGNGLDIGGSLFVMNQYLYNNPAINMNNTQSLSLKSFDSGFGIMGNLGAQYHILKNSLIDWTGGVSEASLGTADFGAAGTLPEMTNVGTGVKIYPGFGHFTADVDYDDVFNQLGFSTLYHVAAGIHYDFPWNIFGLSLGVFQGQPTFGADLNLKLVRIQAAEWTMAAYENIPANRMVGVQASIGWL